MKRFMILMAAAMLGMHGMAAVIPFSMNAEAAAKNTPEGWNEVQLPTGIPTITEANTFVITDAPSLIDAVVNGDDTGVTITDITVLIDYLLNA